MSALMTTAAKKEWLKSVALFSNLSDEELTTLAAAGGAMAVPKHGRVFEEGSPGDCCYVLTAGEARVVLSAGGDSEVLVATIRPRMLVGELALLDGSPRSAALVAAALCRFIRIPAAAFEQLRKNAAFEQRLVKYVASTLRDSNERIRGVSNASSLARVAWCLSRVARQEGTLDRGGILIPKKAHQELAEMAGCSRETVTRALSALKRKKCVSWSGTTMRLEIEALQRYVRTELHVPGVQG
jgi:CRP-like cAMP-binding protein